jgi:uncharacterized protein
MKLEFDRKRVEKLARQKEVENWNFRTWLKGWCDVSSEEIDARFLHYYQLVAKEIDCTKCANCCIKMQPLLSSEDIGKLAEHVGLSYSAFYKRYVMEDEEGEGFVFNKMPCPFLKDKKCTVYASRPEECRSYPHLDKKDRVYSMSSIFGSCFICPIVYNVYELMKKEFSAINQP